MKYLYVPVVLAVLHMASFVWSQESDPCSRGPGNCQTVSCPCNTYCVEYQDGPRCVPGRKLCPNSGSPLVDQTTGQLINLCCMRCNWRCPPGYECNWNALPDLDSSYCVCCPADCPAGNPHWHGHGHNNENEDPGYH